MKRACIAIVDAAHARLYTYQKPDEEPPIMREVRDLVNAGRQAHGMFADAQSRRHGGGAQQGVVDDHRSDHIAELETRFARTVTTEIERIMGEHGLGRLILVASPRMLGMLRKEQARLRHDGIILDEVPQDLAWLTSTQLHDHLAAMSLIAPRERPGFVRGAQPR